MKPQDTSGLDPAVAQALAALPYGLYFLTTGELDRPSGMLISWVSQVSGRPPLLMAALRHNRGCLPALQERQAFALNLLSRDDKELVKRLGRPAEERFQGVELSLGPLGLPVLAAAAGVLVCEVDQVWQPGDHVLVVGEVSAARWRGEGPLLTTVETGHSYLGLK